MKQIKTARERLAKIEKDFFRGADLAAAGLLEGDKRRAFRLSQVERLLTERYGSVPLAMWLSDMFWTADEGRVQYDENPTPLLSLKEQQTLTEKEMSRLRLILEIVGLCHDLSLHFTFDLEDAFGIKNNHPLGYSDFSVSNKQLVEWLTTTEYEYIAMHTAYTMKKFAIGVYAYGHYQPAQDELAELFSTEYSELIREPEHTKMPPRDYVQTILDAMLAIQRHWQRGRRLKLRPDLVMLHDEIYGVVPRQFDKGVLKAAQALYDYMDNDLYGRLVGQDDSTKAELLERFAAKVREVRNQYLAKGWIADYSLEFNYLMAHAEHCGYGWWREEDEAL